MSIWFWFGIDFLDWISELNLHFCHAAPPSTVSETSASGCEGWGLESSGQEASEELLVTWSIQWFFGGYLPDNYLQVKVGDNLAYESRIFLEAHNSLHHTNVITLIQYFSVLWKTAEDGSLAKRFNRNTGIRLIATNNLLPDKIYCKLEIKWSRCTTCGFGSSEQLPRMGNNDL